jgi:hypothetical protein
VGEEGAMKLLNETPIDIVECEGEIEIIYDDITVTIFDAAVEPVAVENVN